MPEIKLKPCPFCGGKAKLLQCDGSFKVECASTSSPICNCMPSTWFCDTEDEAIAMWNKRAELPPAQPEIIRCKDCKHRGETEDGEYNPEDIVCAYWMSDGLSETDYCSYAERREEDGRGERMSEIKLKPCPFCGGEAELLIVPGKMTKWVVRCTKCYANNGTFVSDHDAVEAWNRRAYEEASE